MDVLSCFIFCAFFVISAFGGELTFELPDNEKQCFFENIDELNVESTLEFQVISGGQYDVDLELISPTQKILYKEAKKQYDSFTWTTEEKGEYRFCFSNEFSTFTHKVVYFDLIVGDEDDFLMDEGRATAMTQMQASALSVHDSLKVVIDYQTHHRLREATGRGFAEDLNTRVQYWSLFELSAIVVCGIGQILLLRSFFTDKKNVTRPL